VALPYRQGLSPSIEQGSGLAQIYDATALDAVDQLAASLLAQLTPPWSRWFGLGAGNDLPPDERVTFSKELETISTTLQANFDRSNFTVEIHQCFLDLVVGGTASLLFEESPSGADSAFRFRAVPLSQVYLAEGPNGQLSVTFRRSNLTEAEFRERFPNVTLEEVPQTESPDGRRIEVIEAVEPRDGTFRYTAFRPNGPAGKPDSLRTGEFKSPPFINFRWMKAPGEAWGRSPSMKALPDIRTANKVVELVLRNASIAVTGIWQADDDGVINPANIRLTPGTIIPKAVGSSGLTPLESPGRFDVSELMLNDLRSRIRHALLVDKLGQINGPRMTATEVVERSAEMARILGATFGRLQSELLTPLINRAIAILRRRGEIPDIRVDGRTVDIQYRSPLAQDQSSRQVQNVSAWLNLLAQMGPQALAAIDVEAAARWSGQAMGVPAELIASDNPGNEAGSDIANLIGAALGEVQENGSGPATPPPAAATGLNRQPVDPGAAV
jgi:hypothetical protein